MSNQNEKEPIQMPCAVMDGDRVLSPTEAAAWVDNVVRAHNTEEVPATDIATPAYVDAAHAAKLETHCISIEPHASVSVALSDEDVASIGTGQPSITEEHVSISMPDFDVSKLSTVGDRTFYDGVEIANPKYLAHSFENAPTTHLSSELQISGSPTFSGALTYTPHPHSPEGRLDRLEETMAKLLALMALGEERQEVASCLVPMPAGLGKGEYIKELQFLLSEYRSFRAEVQNSSVYRSFSHRPAGSF